MKEKLITILGALVVFGMACVCVYLYAVNF